MENGEITDAQISASSQWDHKHAAVQGRLNFRQQGLNQAWAWCAGSNDPNQWLQVDLGSFTTVAGVATQGRPSQIWRQWVKSFKLEYSNDGVTFQFYKETWNSSATVSSWGGGGGGGEIEVGIQTPPPPPRLA